MRFVLVHYHIFKNGGSTIESILDREFQGRFATVHGRTPNCTLDAEDLASFLKSNTGVAAISSHHFRYPKPSIRNVALFDWCFIRHPLDRIRSIYTYFRGMESNGISESKGALKDPLGELARRHMPREFVSALLRDRPHMISDVQVMLLGHAGIFTRPATEEDFERAVAALPDMSIPGLVEMFDESLLAAEHFLQPAFPGLRLEYVPQNVSYADTGARTDRETTWNRLWGADMTAELKRLNQLDLRLYSATEQEISRRLRLVPHAQQRLAEFRGRCRHLQTAESNCA